MSFRVLRPAIFSLEPELAHRVAIAGLKILPKRRFKTSDILKTQIAGIEFPNPMGVVAGFDKNAEVPDALLGLGFGFAEVGSITPRPQYGNPRPRLFRLREDRGASHVLTHPVGKTVSAPLAFTFHECGVCNAPSAACAHFGDGQIMGKAF